MKVWVTGESSFISRNFVRWCAEHDNKHEVVNRLGNAYYDYFRNYSSGYKGYENEIDIFDPTLPVLVERSEADVILHNAAFVGTDYCTKNPDKAIRTNIEGTLHVIDAAKQSRIPVIFTSTSVCYKPTDQPIKEDHTLEPQTIYGMTKLAGEHLLKTWMPDENFVTLVPAMLFGAYDLHSAANKLIMSGLNMLSSDLHINLDPEYLKPFMFVDNYLDGIDVILDNIDSLKGERINVAPDDNKTFEEVILAVQDHLGLVPEYELHPNRDYLGPHTLDNSKLKSLGWTQRITLEEGLDRVKFLLKSR